MKTIEYTWYPCPGIVYRVREGNAFGQRAIQVEYYDPRPAHDGEAAFEKHRVEYAPIGMRLQASFEALMHDDWARNGKKHVAALARHVGQAWCPTRVTVELPEALLSWIAESPEFRRLEIRLDRAAWPWHVTVVDEHGNSVGVRRETVYAAACVAGKSLVPSLPLEPFPVKVES